MPCFTYMFPFFPKFFVSYSMWIIKWKKYIFSNIYVIFFITRFFIQCILPFLLTLLKYFSTSSLTIFFNTCF